MTLYYDLPVYRDTHDTMCHGDKCGPLFAHRIQSTQRGAGRQNFPSALIRGGYWDNGSNAGVFALSAYDGPSLSGISIGFRCAR